MLYKRPMFKMGGSPTGIATLTPRVNARLGFPKFSFFLVLRREIYQIDV